MKAVEARKKQWSLARLCEECPKAAAVWTALREMAEERGSVVLTPTRAHLSEATGITRLKTISASLTALESAGWIDIAHVPVFEGGLRSATLLRIVLRRGRKPPQDSPTERGALLRSSGASSASASGEAEEVHPVVHIEKKRLEEIRRRRSGEQSAAVEDNPESIAGDEMKREATKC